MANRNVARAVRMALIAASAASAGLYVPGAAAQDQEQELEQIVVTGSRIARQDFISNSPIASVTQEQIVGNADVTLDMYLNTLPQVNPAGGSTSNNPPNGGQSNIDLRGLGSNRTVVLMDGRRPMVSASDLTVDLNTIPVAMIESVEVITGGAGAAYGADAVAGAVNIRLRKNFEGVDLRGGYSNTTAKGDAEEYNYSMVLGGKFGGGGHALLGYEKAFREGITKGQREFSAFATSTTPTPPQGALRWGSGNPVPVTAIQQVFEQYDVEADQVNGQSGLIGFNRDGTLIYYGVPGNTTLDVQNFRDPIDVSVNQRFYPDFYSYNFDAPNILVLPLERDSFMSDVSYELESGVEFFGQVGWTQYTSASALAPTPVPSVRTWAPGENSATSVASAQITPGQFLSGSVVIPATNPFITPDLRTLLDARTGDDPIFVGSGATEAFRYGFRPTQFGLRQSNFTNTVQQWLGGVKGPLFSLENWDWEIYSSEGRTKIENRQTGNLDTQRLTDVFANPATGGGACSTWNPFLGSAPIPASCITYLAAVVSSQTEFTQKILQGFVRGEVMQLPAGPLSVVLGAESRRFTYDFFYNGAPGPFSGFNVGDPDGGKNSFVDYFGEALVPIVEGLELSLGYRSSTAEFEDTIKDVESDSRTSPAYKIELSWAPLSSLRLRGSYQRSVREPNFGELFSSSTSFPQIFDPCSVYSAKRTGADAAAVRQLCIDTGIQASVVDTFVASPGGQAQTVTDGNTDLDAEEADTYTIGAVFLSESDNQWLSRLRGSIDYYDIQVSDALIPVGTNDLIAKCFNYYGDNPDYSIDYGPCAGILRSGGAIFAIDNVADPDGEFTVENQGEINTSGIDIQIAYGMDLEWLGAPATAGGLDFNLLVTHVLNWEQNSLDYTGTIPYFGAGLGQAFPDWKATLNIGYAAGPIGFDLRARYIDSMKNRARVEFPGETYFGVDDPGPDVDSIIYLDATVSWDFLDDIATLRVGVNNLTDEGPETYAPNVQSGTDPSTYDVVGRRAFAQLQLKF